MLSQLTTDGPAKPLEVSTGTSVESPRMVVVIGATVTVERCGRTSSRVRMSTGRALSICATWIGRIRSGKRGALAGGVLGQPGKLRIRAGAGQDLCVASGYRASVATALLDRHDRQVVLIDDDYSNAENLGITTSSR